ncbi:MAG: light-harvesting protein [Anaerolineales bacterium]|nr:light-harvesting protein [Anaerolineales bacterium]MCB9127091.1 light-harvesting protein [Ardenticatenales bacterium]
MKPGRPIEFRTTLILYIVLGLFVALTIHFILLSSPTYNWLS